MTQGNRFFYGIIMLMSGPIIPTEASCLYSICKSAKSGCHSQVDKCTRFRNLIFPYDSWRES